jgi:hypothetical protein
VSKKLPKVLRTEPLPRTIPTEDCIVIQSNGFGVESQAIWERWCAEPESRPFVHWHQLIVVSAQVGEEHKNDTIRDFEARTLPMMRERGVRFVEVARKGFLEEDGIVVLQDTREPHKLHPEGVYRLSEYLLRCGTVPQFGGPHKCAIKFKAFVIETWLALEFQHLELTAPVYHVFGYNADEITRTDKSDYHIARHNADREIPQPKTPLMVFGFNSEEVIRVQRSMAYDGPSRIGNYPLDEWAWNRDKCLAYIFEQSGILWRKSHCSGCPFCAEAARGEPAAVTRWTESPHEAARWMLVEYNSLCFNFRGHLYRDRALQDVIRKVNVEEALVEFAKLLETIPWALYRVRRIYTKKGKAVRYVEKVEMKQDLLEQPMHSRDRAERLREILIAGQELTVETLVKRRITYKMFAQREPATYPTREGFYVVAPAFMEDKLRGKPAKFNERWERVGAGLPTNPPTPPKKPKTASIK